MMAHDGAPSNLEELQQAFELSNQLSEQLTAVYLDLQKQVEQLTHDLATANSELRCQLEEKERLSERLSRLLAALPAGVVVLDAEDRVAEANPAALQLLDRLLLGERWQMVCAEELNPTTTPGEWMLGHGRGEHAARRVSISSSNISEQGGEILLIHDMTDAYQMQEQLQRHQRLSSMGEMVAGLAHQLRTPLAAALLYTSHLRGELSDEDRVRFADKALARLHSLEHLIKDMLIFVRGGQGGQEPIAAQMLLNEVQQVMEPQMAHHGVLFSVCDSSAGAHVLGSREALAGALTNLLVNAMQACQPGERVGLTAQCDHDMLVFSVADTGKGIPQELQDRLFEPFFTTRTEGTGLGLAIVREVLQMHGGEVTLHSTEGEGSEFRLKLPRCHEE